MEVCTVGGLYRWRCVQVEVCTGGGVYRWRCVHMEVFTGGDVYRWRCVQVEVFTGGDVYRWRCVQVEVLINESPVCVDRKLEMIYRKYVVFPMTQAAASDVVGGVHGCKGRGGGGK